MRTPEEIKELSDKIHEINKSTSKKILIWMISIILIFFSYLILLGIKEFDNNIYQTIFLVIVLVEMFICFKILDNSYKAKWKIIQKIGI